MKITILSGGSGNDSLIKGLKSIYKNVDVKVVVNAYDNGLSTGVCRSITNTLGVSDIRKNHIRMYKAMNPDDQLDTRLIEFYENRYDLEPNCESSAPSSINKSKISSKTLEHLALGLSTLLITTIGFAPASNAFFNTNLVCGIAPS